MYREEKSLTFETIQADMQPKLLCLRDPLGRLFLKLSPTSIWPIVAIALAVYGLAMVGGGITISLIYRQRGMRFLSIFDPQELPIAIFTYLVCAPLLLSFYTWQPRGVSYVFYQLHRNGVIGEPKSASAAQAVSKPSVGFNKGYYLPVSLVAVAVSLVIWLNTALSPKNNPFYFGETLFWWLINPLYFWIVWIPLVFVHIYILSWIVIRQTAATVTFVRTFQAFEIKPKLFHPDGCNGLASVGDYAIRSALLAVFFGFWLFVFTTYPMLFGQPINLKTDTILLYMVYVIAVPSLLLPPVWGAHIAMTQAKNKILENLAAQIQALLTESNIDKILTSRDLLQELRRRYEIFSKEYRTWPFRPLSIKGFGISAITPLVSTGISYVIDLYVRR